VFIVFLSFLVPTSSTFAMNLVKYFALIFTGLILTQCGEKKTARSYVQEGIEYSNQGHYSKAGESFLKAVEEDPKNLEGHYGLGGIYNLEKKYVDAEKAFMSAIQLDPTHYNAWYSLGYTYELMGKKEDAEKSYAKYHQLKGQMDTIMNKKNP
jgi:Tfp pilus assembly protein PilF